MQTLLRALLHPLPPAPEPFLMLVLKDLFSCHLSPDVFSPHLLQSQATLVDFFFKFPDSCNQMSLLFTSGGQRIGVSASASVLPMNIQD